LDPKEPFPKEEAFLRDHTHNGTLGALFKQQHRLCQRIIIFNRASDLGGLMLKSVDMF